MHSYALVTILLTLLASVLYVYKCFKYWESRGIPFITPRFPFGNVGVPFFDKTGLAMHVRSVYDQLKQQGVHYGGFYAGTTPVLLAVHPDFIKTVLSTEFHHFTSQGTNVDEKIDPLSANLFHMDGQKWKDMRVKLTPTLSSGNIKMMFEPMADCGKAMNEYVDSISSKPVNIQSVLEYFTTNVTTSCLLGLQNSPLQNKSSNFIIAGKNAFKATPRLIVRHFLSVTAPYLINIFKFKLFSDEVTTPFFEMVKEVIATRNSNGVTFKNVIQILMDAKHSSGFTVEQIAAQSFGFFLGGFETTSLTLTFCLYELARRHDIQEKLRKEIDDVTNIYDGELTYDGIMKMKYLDQVVKETLRLYPLAPTIRRECTEDFTLPNKTTLKRGSAVFVSVYGLHREGKYFENPDEFEPERFSEENNAKMQPFTYIPFGGGPRICIGKRFGMLQVKVGLVSLIKEYQINPHESLKYPMEFNNNAFLLEPRDAVILNLKKNE